MSTGKTFGGRTAYLDDGKAKYGSGDIAYPHASDHGNKHVRYQNDPRLRPGLAENESRHQFGDMVF